MGSVTARAPRHEPNRPCAGDRTVTPAGRTAGTEGGGREAPVTEHLPGSTSVFDTDQLELAVVANGLPSARGELAVPLALKLLAGPLARP